MKDRNSADETDKGRRDRVPFGGHRRRLEVHNKDPNYVYYWFNDSQDRIARALGAGYEFVNKKDLGKDVGDKDVNNGTSSLDTRVSKKVGEDLTVYLMRIKREYWEQDQAAKQKEADLIDHAIQGGSSSQVPHSYGLDVHYKR